MFSAFYINNIHDNVLLLSINYWQAKKMNNQFLNMYMPKTKKMKKFNPFYIEPSTNILMGNKDIIIINSFDLREGKSLTEHLKIFHLYRDDMINFMSYLWLTLTSIGNDESAYIVRQEQKALEKYTVKGFSDINTDEWVAVAKKK